VSADANDDDGYRQGLEERIPSWISGIGMGPRSTGADGMDVDSEGGWNGAEGADVLDPSVVEAFNLFGWNGVSATMTMYV
jgi:hypothetical protein